MRKTTPAFAERPLTELLGALQTSPDGLDSAQAKLRLERSGPNVLQRAARQAWWWQLAQRVNNPLVLILLGASLVSAFLGELSSFVIISLIVLLSVAIDFVQEYRASQAVERLRQSVAVRATVLRDGHPQELPMRELVPGDVVLLAAGDLVPADGCLLQARDFFVNQALFTGESFPVEKHARETPSSAPQANPTDAIVFMGTSVVSGSATLLVCATGQATALGEIAGTLTQTLPPTAFAIGTRRFGMLIMRLTMLLVLFVLLVNLLFQRPPLESFLFAVALAVGLTPELLPMIMTVTLARGALRLAQQKVITKQLAALQNLGGMDVLCTDKTGTLTEAHIRLVSHLDISGQDNPQVLTLAYLNSHFETGLRSPLDTAILEHGAVDVSTWRKIDEVPFDFERRRVSVLLDNGQDRRLVIKGSPEDILRLSTHYVIADEQPLPLDEAALARAQSLYQQLSQQGLRCLGVAWRSVPAAHDHAGLTDETELIFAGFACFMDPPKASAGTAIRALTGIGIKVKIITGDNELVTRHLCEELGLPVQAILTGEVIQQLNDVALAARALQTQLFCRVTPNQKNRIILALKARGHTVGYIGDGVNDAPSLHTADIGISVDSAVDVAKEAADMILLEQDLTVLHRAVLEGRRTFGNVMKYIMMATSSNFGNMFSMAAASLLLPFLPMLPLQILLNNLLYDLSEIPIPLDDVDAQTLARPQQWDIRFIRNFMWTIGPISSLFDFLTFALLLIVFKADEASFHTGWFMESLATQVLVIFVIRTRQRPWQSLPTPALLITSLAMVAIALLLPLLPWTSPVLGFTGMPLAFYVVLPILVLLYLSCVEIAKQRFYHHLSRRHPKSANEAAI